MSGQCELVLNLDQGHDNFHISAYSIGLEMARLKSLGRQPHYVGEPKHRHTSYAALVANRNVREQKQVHSNHVVLPLMMQVVGEV